METELMEKTQLDTIINMYRIKQEVCKGLKKD